jgi:hypothetical protein
VDKRLWNCASCSDGPARLRFSWPIRVQALHTPIINFVVAVLFRQQWESVFTAHHFDNEKRGNLSNGQARRTLSGGVCCF